jgi:hypothetical protein
VAGVGKKAEVNTEGTDITEERRRSGEGEFTRDAVGAIAELYH